MSFHVLNLYRFEKFIYNIFFRPVFWEMSTAFECDPVITFSDIKGWREKREKTNSNKWAFYSSLNADSGTGTFNAGVCQLNYKWYTIRFKLEAIFFLFLAREKTFRNNNKRNKQEKSGIWTLPYRKKKGHTQNVINPNSTVQKLSFHRRLQIRIVSKERKEKKEKRTGGTAFLPWKPDNPYVRLRRTSPLILCWL